MMYSAADKFTTSYGTVTPSQCKSCKYWSPDHSTTCAAFPGGIPISILGSDVDHKKPYPGDNGIQWTAK